MGRPLYSKAYDASPAIRDEPESTPVYCEKWSHWNPFDPDSDEFFEDDNAVYEAFIDPSAPLPRGEEDPIMVELGDVRHGLAPGEDGMQRGSPMAVGPDDSERMIVDAYFTGRVHANRANLVDEPVRERRAGDPPFRRLELSQYAAMADRFFHNAEVDEPLPRRRSASVSVGPRGNAVSHGVTESLPHTSDITPINLPSSRFRAGHRSDPSTLPPWTPSSPPSATSFNNTTPSPAPSVTPRLYSWSVRPSVVTPGSPSQGSGPLTNPSARMSLAHIAPTLARVRDVVI